MSTPRNAPCPCGSGKKHKQCCGRPGQEPPAGRQILGQVSPAVDRELLDEAVWEVELATMAAGIGNDPQALPAVLLCCVDELVAAHHLLDHAPSEPEAQAELIEQFLRRLMLRGQARPARVLLRYAELVEHLAPALDPLGIAVEQANRLPSADPALLGLREHLDQPAQLFLPPGARTWAAWGHPPERVAALFAAAADFYRAEPWQHMYNRHLLRARVASGREWVVSVLGNGGEVFGLTLYAAPEDARDISRGAMEEGLGRDLRGAVLMLDFNPRKDIPGAMQREVERAGWALAGPKAWPLLMLLRTPGGALSAAQLEDLTACLRALPGFAAAHATDLEPAWHSGRRIAWRDEAEGVELRFDPTWIEASPWQPPAALAPVTAHGSAARPEAALEGGGEQQAAWRRAAAAVLERFEEALVDSGLSEKTVELHDYVAALFVEDFLIDSQGVPLTAVTEYDLRIFVFDWYPRKVMVSLTEQKRMPASLRRLFKHMAEQEGIVCPWAKAVLAEREAYHQRLETVPGHFFFSDGMATWQAELYRDLDRRLLLHDEALVEDLHFGDMLGSDESDLQRELQRRWLLWLDALVREGRTDPAALWPELRARQQAWAGSPHPGFDGRTPVQVIRAERRRTRTRRRF